MDDTIRAARRERIDAALEAAAERKRALTPEQRKEIDMMVLLATHLLMCCPIESLGGEKHKWHRDKQPAIGSEDCRCKGKPMRVLDAEFFLEIRKGEA